MVQPTRGSRGEHRLAEASGVRNHGMSICCAKCQLEWKCLPRRWYYFSVVYGGKLAEDIRRSSTEVSVQKRRKNHTHHTRFKRVHQFWAISWNHIKLNFCSVEELLFSWRTSVQLKNFCSVEELLFSWRTSVQLKNFCSVQDHEAPLLNCIPIKTKYTGQGSQVFLTLEPSPYLQ